jgi:hypothetical protein
MQGTIVGLVGRGEVQTTKYICFHDVLPCSWCSLWPLWLTTCEGCLFRSVGLAQLCKEFLVAVFGEKSDYTYVHVSMGTPKLKVYIKFTPLSSMATLDLLCAYRCVLIHCISRNVALTGNNWVASDFSITHQAQRHVFKAINVVCVLCHRARPPTESVW